MIISNFFNYRLDEIFNKLQNIYQQIGDLNIQHINIAKIENTNIISFAPEKIKNRINNKLYNIYQIDYGEFKIKLITNTITDLHIEILKRLITLHLFFNSINVLTKLNLTLYLFLENDKKLIPNSQNIILTGNMINSAQCLRGKYISIYRKEECLKTCIHEFIHFNGYDKYLDNKHIELNSYNNVELMETFAESMACILNIMFRINNFKQFKPYLKKEIQFSYHQTALMLKINNMSFYDLTSGNKKFNEKTNAIAYYILKLCLIKHINSFLNNPNKMVHILNAVLRKDKMNKRINKYINKLNTKKKYFSGRMTIHPKYTNSYKNIFI